MARLELTTLFLENNILPIKLHPPKILNKFFLGYYNTGFTGYEIYTSS